MIKHQLQSEQLLIPSAQSLASQKRWIEEQVEDIGMKTLQKLAKVALSSRSNAYSPYSNFQVGAAVLTETGKIYGGCNAEACSYTQTTHAEENAVRKAVSEGAARKKRRFLRAVATCTSSASVPCAHCRQILAEHADNLLVLGVDSAGNIQKYTSLAVLMPFGFTPTDLGIK